MKVVKLGNHNMNKFNHEIKGPCIILFHHPECPHCISLRPVWEKVKKSNANRPIKIIEIDANGMSNLNHPIKHQVRGFPQIMRVENEQTVEEFNQPNNHQNLSAFLNRGSPKRTVKRKAKSKKNKTKGKKRRG